MTTILQIVSVHALQKVPLTEMFAESDTSPAKPDIQSQLTFNDLLPDSIE
jgi:hypothetical protein